MHDPQARVSHTKTQEIQMGPKARYHQDLVFLQSNNGNWAKTMRPQRFTSMHLLPNRDPKDYHSYMLIHKLQSSQVVRSQSFTIVL